MIGRVHRMRRALPPALAALVLALATGAAFGDRPSYDVPRGYTRCPGAEAWNGFFKWASVRRTTCRRAARFMRAYADAAARGPMPRRLRGFRCRLRFWRNADGDVYASRHRCRRDGVTIRFYGMV
ncbi:MAG TPA: hypothetical protein VN213_02505 [Solirubrobacteraceae bacterium]|nr:hypothetical protein [Solirubrobacteraceae bacterium]